jgi:Metallo-peptidase family M12B Reprolysin-like
MLRVHGLQVALALIVAGGATEATAQQKKSPPTTRLFNGAPGQAPSNENSAETLGMRPGTVGSVVRVPLSLSATSSLTAQNDEPRRLEVALPGGRSVTCLLRPVARPRNMVVLGGAPLNGGESESCNLVVQNGKVTGEVDLESGRYRIQPIGTGATHAVIEVKTENLPDELAPKVPAEPMPERAAADTAMCDVKSAPEQQPKIFGPIRIMFLYTKAVAAGAPNIRGDIELLMQQLRTGFSATRLGGNFSVTTELAHAQEVNYEEGENMEKDLDRLSSPRDAVFKPIHALRDTHKADIVHMLIKAKPNNGCGIGWMNLAMRPEYAFSVSDYQCAMQNFSAVHEIGHNVGMAHDRFVEKDAKPGPDQFNFGFVAMERGTRSLMSYNDQCMQQKKNCMRLLQLSSPNIKVGGIQYGNPMNHPQAAYNVEVLCRNAPIAAKFR